MAQLYSSGKLDQALALARKHYQGDAENKHQIEFLLLYAKILIDAEGPSSQIRGLLAEAHLLQPQNQEVLDYMEFMEAKGQLRKGLEDQGETRLRALLRRAPQNVQSHFTLGAHLFWTDNQPTMAIPHLETCVRLTPNFLRAWGCLAAIYTKLGNRSLANMAFQKCAELETEPKMQEFFRTQMK